MNYEKPLAVAQYENIRRLDDIFIESFGKRRRDARGASDPGDIALHTNPLAAERDANALGVRENPLPSLAHFVPAQQQIPSGMHALDVIVMRPNRFHLGRVQGLKRCVEAVICLSDGVLGT